MSRTLLETVVLFAGENGLPVPTAIIGSSETTVVQYKSLLIKAVDDLLEHKWQQQSIRKTFTSIAAEDQGLLSTLIGADYLSLIQASMWDETLRRPIFGPVGDASWEMLKAFTNTGPLFQYRIAANHLLINPTMTAGHTIGLIYMSSYGILNGTTAIPSFTADTNTFLFPDSVVYKSLTWRWKKVKGEPWEDDYADYLDSVARNKVKDTAAVLYMDRGQPSLVPGIWVPAGNWPV